ncbi:MAG: DUF1211 domain-containing protein [Acidimicrobiia bacterium]|nr:DUF1211 domain-containing protein [Acidimicrobiia bacterium]
MNKARIEAFSDGVFAIAITLLVLTIAQPTNYRHLEHQLWIEWPSLAAYVVSFMVIGIMWLNHHSVFGYFARVDRPLVYLNLLLLLTVVFIPYPTGVLGEALHRSEGTRVAAVVYSVTMAVNAYCWAALWVYASSGRRLLRDDFPEVQRRSATVAFTVGPIVYTLAIGIALINAYAMLAFHALLAVYYAVDPISRRVAAGAES